MEKMRPTKKKPLLLAAGCLALAAVVVITFFVLRPAPKTLYHFQPGQVTEVTLQHNGDIRDVTDPAQIEEIVDLLNGFTYRTSRDVAPATGWEYHAVLSTGNESYDFTFSPGTLRIWNDDGSSTIYSGPSGYLQPLVDMADGITPVISGESLEPEEYSCRIRAEDITHLYIADLTEVKEITSQEDIRQVVELLNNFPCQSIEEETYVPTDWWSFSMDGHSGAFFKAYFTADDVRISDNTYHGPEGYFQPMMDMMETASSLPVESAAPDVSSPSALNNTSQSS